MAAVMCPKIKSTIFYMFKAGKTVDEIMEATGRSRSCVNRNKPYSMRNKKMSIKR